MRRKMADLLKLKDKKNEKFIDKVIEDVKMDLELVDDGFDNIRLRIAEKTLDKALIIAAQGIKLDVHDAHYIRKKAKEEVIYC